MYESPIELVYPPISQTEVIHRQDEQIYRAVQSVGVNVDKEELIKALNYDRQQYNKGYCDGARELAERLKEQMKDLTRWKAGIHTYFVIGTEFIDNILKETVGEG